MEVDGRLPIGQRYGDVMIHILTANIGRFVFWRLRQDFINNVQEDNSDDEISNDSSSSMENDPELAQSL
jgi:hypothetical protein